MDGKQSNAKQAVKKLGISAMAKIKNPTSGCGKLSENECGVRAKNG